MVVLADADGSNQAVVSMTPLTGVSRLTWSPDGRSIAVTAGDDAIGGSLWIVHTVDRTIRKIDVVPDYDEVYWRPPDGRQLMVTAMASGGVRFVLASAVDGGLEVLPAPVGARPGGWSLDGRRFAYGASDADGLVHVLDVAGGPDIVIRPSLPNGTGGYPRFSNDARRILFMEWSTGESVWLSVAPSDGSTPAIRISEVYPEGIGTDYHWSPDDTVIVFRPNDGAPVALDPAGGLPSSPPWLTESVESWQRLAP